ncbi:MAG: imidazole glycerol phosphate synthase subunit HisH [Pseudomonadota bacterium]
MASRQKCVIIDYGMGNLHSVQGALRAVAEGAEIVISADPKEILSADRVVLPGVGAIRDCMAELNRQGFPALIQEVRRTKPLLGICLGLQAMLEHSEENGGAEGLGLFKGQVKFFGHDLNENGTPLKVPHMGWNQVQQSVHPLWVGIEDNSRFYFVHSYYVQAANREDVVGRCHYGLDFDVALAQDNVFAVQFHPEKSHQGGLTLLKNFLSWDGQGQ